MSMPKCLIPICGSMLLSTVLIGCQTAPTSPTLLQGPELYVEAFNGAAMPVESMDEIFALSEAEKKCGKG